MLKFGKANAKLKALQAKYGKVYTLSLLSGHTCPFAKECYSKAFESNGSLKIVDGPDTQFRCFSASNEVTFPGVYQSRKHNTDLIKSCGNDIGKMVDMIESALPKDAKVIRVHVAGDMMTLNYMKAWLKVAANNPNIIFYSYTKSLPLLQKCLEAKLVPKNYKFTMSRGGKRDDLIPVLKKKYKMKEAKVVFHPSETKLEIDHDDSHAIGDKDFSLLLHGTMPKGSKAADAIKRMKKENIKFSYS